MHGNIQPGVLGATFSYDGTTLGSATGTLSGSTVKLGSVTFALPSKLASALPSGVQQVSRLHLLRDPSDGDPVEGFVGHGRERSQSRTSASFPYPAAGQHRPES